MCCKKTDANRLSIAICIGAALWTTTACSRYNLSYPINTKDTKIDATKTEKRALDPSRLLQVDQSGMTPFCKAIEEGNYKQLKEFLEEIASPTTRIINDVISLITGIKQPGNQLHPSKALLARVITSYEDEVSECTYTEELLNILFNILKECQPFDLGAAFLQKHGADQNTIMHLAVNTANLAIIKCLISCYPKQHGAHDLRDLMRICSIPNQEGTTPLWMALKAIYHDLLMCGTHKYEHEHDSECETCDYRIEMTMRQKEIILYLLELGVPFYETRQAQISAPPLALAPPSPENREATIQSVLHYVSRHDSEDFVINMMDIIQTRAINKYTPEDLVSLKDKKGNSLLFYAVRRRNYTLAKYLLALGACPMQPNHKGICPILCSVAFRDTDMLQHLLKAPCLLERICSIHKNNNNAQKILEAAKSPDCGGMLSYLKKYCDRFKKEHGIQIVPDEWDWQPNARLEQLVSSLCNYSAGSSNKESNLPFHDRFDRTTRPYKRKCTTHAASVLVGNQNKRRSILGCSPGPTPSPFGGA